MPEFCSPCLSQHGLSLVWHHLRHYSESFSVMEGTHFPGSDAEALTFWSTCRQQTATKDAGGVFRCTLNPGTRSGAVGGWQSGSFRSSGRL